MWKLEHFDRMHISSKRKMIPGDDKYFLLYFIMGTYFGPDLKGERIEKSALQRRAEGLPPYALDQLSDSHIRTSQIELIYYFLMRNAGRSLLVKIRALNQFIQGNHPSQSQDGTCYPQFPALFPPDLHPQTESLNGSRLIENVMFIRNPAIFYIKQADIERFKRLTGLEDLFIENHIARLPNCTFLGEVSDDEDEDAEVPIVQYFRECQSRKRLLNEILETESTQHHMLKRNGAARPSYELVLPSSAKQLRFQVRGPGVVVLPSPPSRQELDHIVGTARNAYALTGSAAKGQMGPVIGLMDVGESEDSYLFRVALPGVKRENRAFQCEVESSGRVQIRGETVTGEKRVYRYSQTFVMQTQNLCPSGPFSVLFHLPGPVDPQRFTGSFGTDGILEGIVMKPEPSKAT